MEKTKYLALIKFWFPVLILILLLIVAVFGEEQFPTWVVNISEIFSVLTALFLYLIGNSIKTFVYWNKFKGFFKRDTVSWEGTYKFSFIYKDYNFEKEVYKFVDRIKLNFKDVNIKRIKINETSATFIMSRLGYSQEIELFYNQSSTENEKFGLTFHYTTSISYSDSKKEIERYEEVLDLVNKGYSVLGDESIIQNSEKELHAVSLSFSKYNPFYGLAVKNIHQSVENISFNLRFTVDNTNIEINKNTLKAVSQNKKQLINVLENYIPLSTIG